MGGGNIFSFETQPNNSLASHSPTYFFDIGLKYVARFCVVPYLAKI